MTVAVCLLSLDRTELTEQTARSFVAWNGVRSDLRLLHCDGGSKTFANVNIAKRHGFRTIAAPSERIGQMETLRIFAREAFNLGADWILWLENDWESVAEIPSAAFLDRAARAGIQSIRLFGAYKMRGESVRAPAGIHVIGTKRLIEWRSTYSEGWEEGRAHWGCGGTLIQTSVLMRHTGLPGLKEIMRATTDLLTLRPRENIMWHIGTETTAGFVP